MPQTATRGPANPIDRLLPKGASVPSILMPTGVLPDAAAPSLDGLPDDKPISVAPELLRPPDTTVPVPPAPPPAQAPAVAP